MRNRLGRTFAIALAVTGVVAGAAPASVVERGRFVDDPYGFSYDCGFPVEVTGVGSGHFRLREGTGDDATALVAAILGLDAVFAPALAAREDFRAPLAAALAGLLSADPMAVVRRTIRREDP